MTTEQTTADARVHPTERSVRPTDWTRRPTLRTGRGSIALALLAAVALPAAALAEKHGMMEGGAGHMTGEVDAGMVKDAADAMPGADAADMARPAEERTDPAAMPGEELLVAGREVFLNVAEPACGVCHTLSDAGSAGEIGPNLDDLAPEAGQVHAAVTWGVGVMPAYEGVLTDEQIDAVSVYVASVTGANTTLDE